MWIIEKIWQPLFFRNYGQPGSEAFLNRIKDLFVSELKCCGKDIIFLSAAAAVLRVGLVQARCGEDPAENLRRTLGLVGGAASRGAALVVLQELFRTRYFCFEENHDWFRLAESVPGPTTKVLASAARKHGVTIVAPLFEKRAPGIYHNTSVLLGPDGSVLDVYRKMHIPDDPGYHEKFYLTPGDLGFRAAKTSAGTIGTLICWDQWFPEAARLTALAGAEILAYPTAIGGIPSDSAEDHRNQADAWWPKLRDEPLAATL